MSRQFHESLQDVRSQLLAMAGHVERAIDAAVTGLENGNKESIDLVFALEGQVNRAHLSIDNSCVTLLALQQPFAADLRLLISVIKINTDLERMGDLAVNIAHEAREYLMGEKISIDVMLPPMFAQVKWMVRESLNSFVQQNASRAREVLMRDDEVDQAKRDIVKEAIQVLKLQSDKVEQDLHLLFIARHLERIADHATNIAEDVIFAVTGEDVRHVGSR